MDCKKSRDLVERAHRTIADSEGLRGESVVLLRLSHRTKSWVAAVRADAWHVRDHKEETDPDDDPERTGEFPAPILEPHAAAGIVS